MKHYNWRIEGTAAKGQTWVTSGTVSIEAGDFPDLFGIITQDSFNQLTQGKAVFGFPGLGCQGPYDMLLVTIKQEKPQ
jgi:hypothetical protein